MINLSKQHLVNAEQAPLQFEIEIETKQNSNSKSKYSCKLCATNKQRFFCKKCLQKGLFTFVNSEERFIDKQQKLNNVINAQKTLNLEFTEKFGTFTRLENLRLSLTKYRNNNALLRDLVREKRESIQKLQEIKRENHEKNRNIRIILPKYEDKVNKLGEYVMIAIEKNDDLRKKSNEQNEKLRVLRRSNIDKLVKYIFPISAKESIIYRSDSESTASDEASRNESMSKEYVISNGPSLSNQNFYFDYCKWLAHNKDGSNAGNNNESGMEVMTHKAYSTIAALTYIVQLLNVLSFYLDVRLHHKMTCNDFCKVLLNEQQFRRKVSKLNYNVAYFLYAQKKCCGQSYSIMESVLQLLSDGKQESSTTVGGGGIDSTSISLSFTDLNEENISDSSDIDDDDDDTAHNKEDWENVCAHSLERANIPSIEVAHHSIAVPHESAMSSTIINNITNVANSLFWNRWNK